MSCLRRGSACVVRRTDNLSAAAASNTAMFTHDNEFRAYAWDCRFPMTLLMRAGKHRNKLCFFLQNTHMRRKNVEWMNPMLPLACMASMKTFAVRLQFNCFYCEHSTTWFKPKRMLDFLRLLVAACSEDDHLKASVWSVVRLDSLSYGLIMWRDGYHELNMRCVLIGTLLAQGWSEGWP